MSKNDGGAEEEEETSIWFRCLQCTRIFPRRKLLKRHKRQVHQKFQTPCSSPGQTDFDEIGKVTRCSQDEAATTDKIERGNRSKGSSSKDGRRRSSTGPTGVKCPTCGKKLSTKASLNQHMRIHSGEKPFACPYCQKRFLRRDHLKQHEVVHTGERPFQCPHCRVTFARQSGRIRHIRRRHQ